MFGKLYFIAGVVYAAAEIQQNNKVKESDEFKNLTSAQQKAAMVIANFILIVLWPVSLAAKLAHALKPNAN